MNVWRNIGRLARFRRVTWLAFASGVALALAYPLFDFHLLAWVALAPLAWALVTDAARNQREETSDGGKRWARAAFKLGFAAGFAFHVVGLYWLLAISVTWGFKALLFIGYLLLAAYLALYFGAWTAALALFLRVAGISGAAQRIGVCVFASVVWVALEWVRSWMLGGFPWNFLGVSLYKMVSLIQIAQWTGVYGVSFLVCFVNIALAFTARRFWTRMRGGEKPAGGEAEGQMTRQARPSPSNIVSQISWEFTLAMLLVMGLAMGSVRSLLRDGETVSRPLTVALAQGNVPQDLKWENVAGERIWSDYIRLTLEAGSASPHLIVWPETATPPPDFAMRRVAPGETGYLAAFDSLKKLATRVDTPLLVGSIDAVVGDNGKSGVVYNAAFLIEPRGSADAPDGPPVEPYRKMRLVPFGEYVPLSKWLPFMKWLTPIPGGFAAGEEYTVFSIKNPNAKFGAVICFEDVMPDHCRQFTARGADFLVTITNDAWFGRTAGAYQHAANSVFRAVENRRPLLRCANTGMTCVVDARGRIVKILEGAPHEKIFVQGVLTHTLQLPEKPPTTFYAQRGDIFAWSCAALSALVIAACAWRRSTQSC